jgi:hypothetical protein
MRPTRALLLSLVYLTTLAFAQPTATQRGASHMNHTDSIVVCVPYSSGWNIVSNPVLRAPGTDSIWQVFCGPTYWWCLQIGGGYVIPCGTTNGRALWMKRQTPTLCCIAGEAIAQISITVANGWNLIGTISYPVAVSSIQSVPPNLMVSKVFQFSGRYVQADTLRPGFGYWVKASGAGQLVLTSGL